MRFFSFRKHRVKNPKGSGAGRIGDIDGIVDRICQSAAFEGVEKEKIRELVEDWFNTGHWWEPQTSDLLLFLEGEL